MSYLPPERLNIARYFLDQRIDEGGGDRLAIRLEDRDLTYSEVQTLANRFGQVLRGLGVRQEERVLIALPDGPEFVGAFFGVLKIGAVVVMVNPQLKPDKLSALFDYTRASMAVVGEDSLESFEQAESQASSSPGVLVVGGGKNHHPTFE